MLSDFGQWSTTSTTKAVKQPCPCVSDRVPLLLCVPGCTWATGGTACASPSAGRRGSPRLGGLSVTILFCLFYTLGLGPACCATVPLSGTTTCVWSAGGPVDVNLCIDLAGPGGLRASPVGDFLYQHQYIFHQSALGSIQALGPRTASQSGAYLVKSKASTTLLESCVCWCVFRLPAPLLDHGEVDRYVPWCPLEEALSV